MGRAENQFQGPRRPSAGNCDLHQSETIGGGADSNSRVKAILLDWHGTLTDEKLIREVYRRYNYNYFKAETDASWGGWKRIEQAAIEKFVATFYDLAADPSKDFNMVIRESDLVYYRTLIELASIRRAYDEQELFALSRKLEMEVNASHNTLHPDAREALETLKAAGYQLMACTSASEAHLMGALKGCGLEGFFDDLYYGERFNSFKNRPDFWKKAFEASGLPAGALLVVDDTTRYLDPPHALGAHCMLIQRSAKPGPSDTPYPVIHSLSELHQAMLVMN
ncbi:MAG: HAD family hydrolase [bacterium]